MTDQAKRAIEHCHPGTLAEILAKHDDGDDDNPVEAWIKQGDTEADGYERTTDADGKPAIRFNPDDEAKP